MARRPKPWYRKARGSWFVTIGGVQHNLGSEKNEAFEHFYELMRQPQAKKVSPKSLAALVDAFLDWTEKHRSPDTYEWYRYRLERFVRRYPSLRVSELKPYHVQTWADSYDFSVTSKRNYLRCVKRCLRWAKKQGYIEANPISELEVPAAEHREVAITDEEFATLLSFVRNLAFEDLLVVTWETGCRPQELLRVEARHVDLKNHRWVFERSESKGKRKSRVVYLTDRALEITKRRMLASPTGPLFRNSNGVPWRTEAVGCAFDRVRQRMGKAVMKSREIHVSDDEIEACARTLKKTRNEKGRELEKSPSELRCEANEKLTFKMAAAFAPKYSLYALRHSWATRALQRGVDSLTVAVLMGHSDPSTLARVYQHLSQNPKHLLEQAKKAAS